MKTSVSDIITQLGSAIAGLMFAYAMFHKYFPTELRGAIRRHLRKLVNFFNPYIHVTFPEFQTDGFYRSVGFSFIERYLNSVSANQARRLKANVARDSEVVVLSMTNYEEVTDEYQGVKLWWTSTATITNRQTFSFHHSEDEKRSLRLTFHRKHREIVTTKDLTYVLSEGKSIIVQERRRKLYTNNKNDEGSRRSMWSHVLFEHLALNR